MRPPDLQGKTTYYGTTGAGQTTPHSTMAPTPALALGRPLQFPHAGRQRHVHHEGERVMTEGDALVFVVDDDAPLRASLENLLRSVGLQVAAFASARLWCINSKSYLKTGQSMPVPVHRKRVDG